MRNKKGVWLVIAMATLMVATCAYAQQEVLKLEHKAFEKRQRPGVTFPHAQHFATIDCMECHHFYVDGENLWDETQPTNCAACHGLEEEGQKLGLRRAFHENCVGCHRVTKPAPGQTLPVMCGECHVWPHKLSWPKKLEKHEE